MIRVMGEQENTLFSRLADEAYKVLSLSGEAVVEVVFVDEDTIRSLNAKHRNVDAVTDVLSFPFLSEIKPFTKANYPSDSLLDGEVMLGSIVICKAVAQLQAEQYGHSVKREECYLFTHGLMHLLGYDHIFDDEKEEMRRVEELVLNGCQISRED